MAAALNLEIGWQFDIVVGIPIVLVGIALAIAWANRPGARP